MVIQQCWLYCSRCYYRASGRAKYFDYVRKHIYKISGHAWHWRLWAGPTIPNLAFGYTNMGENFQLLLGSQRRNHLCMILVKAAAKLRRELINWHQYVNTWRITLIDTGDQTMSGGQLKRLNSGSLAILNWSAFMTVGEVNCPLICNLFMAEKQKLNRWMHISLLPGYLKPI